MTRTRYTLLGILILTFLCWLFFWRLLTPVQINQQSLVEGDFSGQFVAFAQYQAVRLGQGEVPLWDPYNNAGSPFLADTQSAVFYPPRLLTIAVLNLTGGSTPARMYDALQKEMVAHTWIASVLMFLFVLELISSDNIGYQQITAALIAGIIFAYGGYLTGYPQLQLAVMEAGIWLPLALLGILKATRTEKIRYSWFFLSGIALALSFLAGHPQTTLFFIYVTLAYLGYQVARTHQSWQVFILGAAIFGIVGVGLAGVQLLPGWEFSRLTARTSALNFDAMGNGFPFYDIVQILFPGTVSLWSPLYFGIVGVALVLYAFWQRVEGAIFWGLLGAIALVLGFGHGTILYDLFYNLIPGFSLFREQERSAYVIAVAASILAGLGAYEIIRTVPATRYKLVVRGGVGLAASYSAALFIQWQITGVNKNLGLVAFALLISVLIELFLSRGRIHPALLIGLVVFELFSFGRTNPNVESISASDRLKPSPLVAAIPNDQNGVFRVDGIGENYGTAYAIQDIQGISPLRLGSVDRLLKHSPERAWDTFGVRYVIADSPTPPAGQIVAKQDKQVLVKLDSSRPLVRLVYKTWVEPNDDQALGFFSDPSFDVANTVMLSADPGITLPAQAPTNSKVEIVHFAPEAVEIQTESSAAAVLEVAIPDYPGWGALLDGQPVPLLRADTAVMAIPVPAGSHTVQLKFAPASYQIGVLISITTFILGAISLAFFIFFPKFRRNPEPAQ